jgi:hypothetical protein
MFGLVGDQVDVGPMQVSTSMAHTGGARSEVVLRELSHF